MNILHVGKYYPPYPGGMENFLKALLDSLSEKAVTCTALVHSHNNNELTGTAVSALGPEIRSVPCLGRFFYAPISPTFPVWLSTSIRETRPELIHFHLPNTSAFWALMSEAAKKIPWVVHWHSDVVSSEIDLRLKFAYPYYRPFEQALLKRATAIIVTSPAYLEASRALEPWKSKCHVIPLGLNPQQECRRAPAFHNKQGTHWGNASYKILSVGRMTYYKGHEILIRAMAEVSDARLILVGSGELKHALHELVAQLNLQDKVFLPGSVDNEQLTDLFATCDTFCLPSIERTEAFGVVLLEAMRAGKPVVASDIPGSGVGWVVQHGKTGLLVPPGDADALAQALIGLKNRQDLRLSMGKKGEHRFESEFLIGKVADDIIKIYNALSN